MNARILLILDCVQGGRLGGWWLPPWWLECVAKDGWCSVGPGGAQYGLRAWPTWTRRRLQITGSPNLQGEPAPFTESTCQDVVDRGKDRDGGMRISKLPKAREFFG